MLDVGDTEIIRCFYVQGGDNLDEINTSTNR